MPLSWQKGSLEMDEALGEMILFHRKQSGLTRIQLADLAGVGKTVIFDIEKGKRSVRYDTLLKVLEALNIKVVFDSPLMETYHETR